MRMHHRFFTAMPEPESSHFVIYIVVDVGIGADKRTTENRKCKVQISLLRVYIIRKISDRIVCVFGCGRSQMRVECRIRRESTKMVNLSGEIFVAFSVFPCEFTKTTNSFICVSLSRTVTQARTAAVGVLAIFSHAIDIVPRTGRFFSRTTRASGSGSRGAEHKSDRKMLFL